MFFAMLLAFTAKAYGQDVTAPPVINFEETTSAITIQVTGEGVLNVQLTHDHSFDDNFDVVMVEEQAYGYFEYTIDRPYDEGYRVMVTATAQEDGKLPSQPVSDIHSVRPYFVMPAPEIMFNASDEGVVIEVTNGGPQLFINVFSNYELLYNVEGSYSVSCFVERTYEDQLLVVNALSRGSDLCDVENGATAEFMLTARELPYTEPPQFVIQETDEYVIVSAVGDGEVHLLLFGEEVENPYYAVRDEMGQVLEFMAYCQAEGMQPSLWVYREVYVSPVPTVLNETAPPSMVKMSESEAQIIGIYEGEPSSTLYYRWGLFNQDTNYYDDFTEWMEYTDVLVFTLPGNYLVEAYAIAPEKLPSTTVSMAFTILEPIPPYQFYDFIENGIYYNVIGANKVEVCSETTEYNSYSGQVTIPATVTHAGVTYMVTRISDNAFCNCVDLTGVTIGDYITEVGNYAFEGCSSLTSVTLGDYVISIGQQAFAHCPALESVFMGSGLAHIGPEAFMDCNALTSVTCKAATPPVMENSDCFECYTSATLHVYPAVLDNYQSTNYWKRFTNIVPEDKVAPAIGDANGDGEVNISDVIKLINYVIEAL